ncbi:MAG: shikimate kinase, partial [Polaribacter sp.]|nr:shikimate kinase [Polaribacter sp.]
MKFLDLDDYIINKEGMSIAEIFEKKGEVYFRVIENKYLKEVLNTKDQFILALGGGTPCYANNMEEINKGDTVSIYLQGKTKTMIDRLIKKKSKRPLIASLADDKISEFVAKHLFERRMYYELAKITVKIDAKTKKEIAKKLKKILN